MESAFFVKNLCMNSAIYIKKVSPFFAKLSARKTPVLKRRRIRVRSGERIFPLHRVISLSPSLAKLALRVEGEICQNFEEFPLRGEITVIEFDAENLLSAHILGREKATSLHAKFVACEVKYGKIFESLLLFKALSRMAYLTRDLLKFEAEIKKGFSARRVPKQPSNAFFFGVLSKNPNATKIILGAGANAKTCVSSLLGELETTLTEIDKISKILSLDGVNPV